MTHSILIVEDDDSLRPLLADELQQKGREIQAAASVREALKFIRTSVPSLILSDFRLGDATGLDLFQSVQDLEPRPGFIIFTAFGTIPDAVNALKQGVDNFLTKPVDLDHLGVLVRKTLDLYDLRRRVHDLKQGSRDDSSTAIIGESKPMKSLLSAIEQLAQTDESILIAGESGTGKELVARQIHARSRRSKGPFIPFNCAAVPEGLAESELYGHTKGAFTGADAARSGLFRASEGGTIFLDEIGELPLPLQASLLRFLQDKSVRPVGSSQEETVDTRIVAATNRDLKSEVKAGNFREDLYYRLETFTLTVPPLRERTSDIPLLTAYFLNEFAREFNKDSVELSSEAMERLLHYRYPGNIRELRSLLKRAVLFSAPGESIGQIPLPDSEQSGTLSSDDLFGEALGLPYASGDLPTLKSVEDRYIQWVLDQVEGNKRKAAGILGIGRRTLYDRLSE